MQQLAFVPPPASPIRQQYLALKRQHPDAILFFQLGDFYETFEDDARLVAQVCDIALTSREMGKGERVPMAGVPIHAAEAYLARLVERGHHIAICQQMEDPAAASRARSSEVERALCQHFDVTSSAAIGLQDRPLAARAVAAILHYLDRTQPKASAAVEQLRVYEPEGHMALDPATREHLELLRGARGLRDGSVVQALDRTRTAMGARALAAWLSHPLVDR